MVHFKETNNPSPQKPVPQNQWQKELTIGWSTVWGPTAKEMEIEPRKPSHSPVIILPVHFTQAQM